MSATVLLYERETRLRKVVAASLRQMGLRIIEAGNAAAARRQMETEQPDLLLLELDHPAGENGALIEAYREMEGEGAVVLTTTQRPNNGWRERYQPEAVIYKPYDIRFLCHRISRLVQDNSTASSFQGKESNGLEDQG